MKRSVAPDTATTVRAAADDAPRTMSEMVYWRLRSDIVWGILEPGAPLRSDELRASYKVGISPLREALSRLAVERLVTTIGQRGFRVAPILATDVVDVMETRLIIERAALARSIQEGGLDWETGIVASLHALSRVSIPQTPGDGAENWAKLHKAFHMALLSACRSEWQLSLAELLFDQSERFRIVRATKVPEPQLLRDTMEEHRMIVDAVLARDEKKALAALESHYRSTTNQVLSNLHEEAASVDAR